MNFIKEREEVLAPPFNKDDYCHYVNATDDRYSMCGIDVSTAAWVSEKDASMCPECEIRMENCGCDPCVGARNEH